MTKISPDWSIQSSALLMPIITSHLVLVILLQGCLLLLLLTSFFMLRIYLFPSSPHSGLVCIKHIECFSMAEYDYNTGHNTILNSSHSRNLSAFPHHRNFLSQSSVILLAHFLISLYPHLLDVSRSKHNTPKSAAIMNNSQIQLWLLFYIK